MSSSGGRLPLVFDRARRAELESHTAEGGSLFDYRKNAGKVERLLRLLAKRVAFRGLAPPKSPRERERAVDGAVELGLRMLASRMHPESDAGDAFQLLALCKRHIASPPSSSSAAATPLEDAVRFEEFHARLMRQTVLEEKWPLLYLLYALRDEGASYRARQVHMPPHRPFGRHAGLEMVDPARLLAMQGGGDENARGGDTSAAGDGGNKSRLGSELARRSAEAAARRAFLRRTVEENLTYEVPEEALLRDIIYTLQGIDGRFVRFDESREAYCVAPGVGVPLPTRRLVLRVTELGWMYRRVSGYVRDTLALPAVGLVEQSFCGALQQELADYYRLVAVLESQLADTLAAGVRHPEYQFTLRRLHVWVQDPLERLRLLAMMADAARGLRGGELASAVADYLQHGDPAVLRFVRRIMGRVCQPVFGMARRWIRAGELEDPFHEFFVAADPAVGRDRMWRDKYSLRAPMRPAFVDAALAADILLIGKSINFLRDCCGEADWQGEEKVAAGEEEEEEKEEKGRAVAVVAAGAGDDPHGDDETAEGLAALRAEVGRAAEAVNRRLMRAMLERYRIEDHCLALKKYLLLGQGDFIQHLMDLLHAELDRPAKQLYKHSLVNIVSHAIRGSNAQYEDAELLDRISVRMLKASDGDCGWDVFSLDYVTSSPIDVVFTDRAIGSYLQVFNFLWRLKRVEYGLTASWTLQSVRAHRLEAARRSEPVRRLLAAAYRLQHEMTHFCNNLHNFMMFEVMEVSWEELRSKLRAARHLDEVVDAHEAYLRQIVGKALMGGPSAKIPLQPVVLKIFDSVVRFTRLQERMHARLAEVAAAREAAEREARARTEAGRWGAAGGSERELLDSRSGEAASAVAAEFQASVGSVGARFRDLLGRFLAACGRHPSPDLRFLRVRIDFNEFYAE